MGAIALQNMRVILLAMFGTVALTSGVYAKESACELSDVPQSVQQVVRDKFLEWRIWNHTDLTSEELVFWLKQEARSSCPGLAIGQFTAKKQRAYAVSLIPKDANREGWRLVILESTAEGGVVSTVIESADDYTDTGILETVPPGTYSDMYGAEKVILQFDGFTSYLYGKGLTLFYWKGGKFHSFPLVE